MQNADCPNNCIRFILLMFSKLSPIDVNNREGGGLDSNVTSRKEIVSGGHGKKYFETRNILRLQKPFSKKVGGT